MRELTRQETKQIQGLSILAMVLLHLFCTYNYEGKFIPLVMLQGVPLVFYFAQFGDFCVFAFAFCSGYGHMAQYEKKKGLVYRAKYPLFIYLFMLGICTAVSYVLQLAEKPLQELVIKHAK